MLMVTTNGADISYEELGSGETLALVPGLGAHSGVWGPFPKTFAERRRVILYDPRGLGKSSAGNRPLTLELMAADLAAVLDAAGAEHASLLGASLGSLVALRFALDFPGRAAKLVLITPAPFRTRYGDWLVETLRCLIERLSPEEFNQTLMLLAFAPPFFDKSYGMVKEVSRMLTPQPHEVEQIRRQLDALDGGKMPQNLSSIDMPVLIIAGLRDVLAPVEEARRLAAKLRRAQLVTLPTGHSPFVEATDEVLKVIREFL